MGKMFAELQQWVWLYIRPSNVCLAISISAYLLMYPYFAEQCVQVPHMTSQDFCLAGGLQTMLQGVSFTEFHTR